ncbi:CBS domain-containing protein [Cohnella lubricantis]|uniref:CBS domain-containing protein n=1 Tax=Cohnella lubricantis TaxID=2163172 RepID=A0A841T9M5_9BACL|nr:CBS domain-containing protein [Cohnella lubricantis]MBB6678213.1 CBS domain-containing protein [Cohnella lubricantis]MBP2120068.1 CBS domain-containing protein [Cohnella lubricantis]
MNIAFFLLPKQEVVCLPESATLRQTLERMERHRYTAVPVLTDDGKYVGTVTEGDLLWFLKSRPDIGFDNAHRVQLSEVPFRVEIRPVQIEANMEDLITLAKTQNFVPVIDDMGSFIGIVRRSDIIDYCERVLLPATMDEKPARREA